MGTILQNGVSAFFEHIYRHHRRYRITEGAEPKHAQLRTELAQVRQQLETMQREAEQARVQAEEADRARVRAEATSDTLRELLDAFRSSGQADEDK